MSRPSLRIAAAGLIALGSIVPAFACDPEDLKAEYRSLCAKPTDAIAQLVAASASRLKPEAAVQLTAMAKEAQAMCLADKHDDAMKLAVRVAKALGSAEQEAGLPREQFAAGTGGTQVAAK
ncbi:MAG: hypothetical protein IOC54_06425 [Methylobacterium sp.]|nr:hypothetical protein [Methylobacterium sp.]